LKEEEREEGNGGKRRKGVRVERTRRSN